MPQQEKENEKLEVQRIFFLCCDLLLLAEFRGMIILTKIPGDIQLYAETEKY